MRNKKRDEKRKKQLKKKAKSGIDDQKQKKKLENTTKFKEFKNDVKSSVYDNLEDNIKNTGENTKYGIGNIIVIGLFIIISLVYYIYSILFTNIQNLLRFQNAFILILYMFKRLS